MLGVSLHRNLFFWRNSCRKFLASWQLLNEQHHQQQQFPGAGRSSYSFWSGSSTNGNGLQKAITDAEKLVGYPTTYNSLKYIIDEEPGNVLELAKKLVGSGHPLLSTARDLLSQDPNFGQNLAGLWVLLLSKAAGSGSGTILDSELVNGIHPKQRKLAETTELINTGKLFAQSEKTLN